MSKPKAIDLFAGAGGLTQGLKDAGFSVVAAVEIDGLAVNTYRQNHRRVRIYENDLNQVDPLTMLGDLGLAPGELDLLAGCPPCQGFSTMRTRNGGKRVRDPKKKDLVLTFLRFATVIRPKVVMMENVPGLENDQRFAKLRGELGLLGYDNIFYAVRNARDFGVPQRRKRLILIASRVGVISLPEASKNCLSVRDAIGGLPPAGRSGDPLHDFPERRSAHVLELIRDIPHDGGSRADLGKDRQLECHKRTNGFKDVYGRMKWDAVAPTITGGCFNPSKGRFLHPVEDRNITMREAALLQGFPPTYKFDSDAGKQAIALMIGNALPPEFIRQHAAGILRALKREAEARSTPS